MALTTLRHSHDMWQAECLGRSDWAASLCQAAQHLVVHSSSTNIPGLFYSIPNFWKPGVLILCTLIILQRWMKSEIQCVQLSLPGSAALHFQLQAQQHEVFKHGEALCCSCAQQHRKALTLTFSVSLSSYTAVAPLPRRAELPLNLQEPPAFLSASCPSSMMHLPYRWGLVPQALLTQVCLHC